MKTLVVLDFYDDQTGSILKKAFPDAVELPEIVKTAHILDREELEVLRNEAFALVMADHGKIMRKFACVDAGNTLLSALYLMENADKLPDEAVKTAADRIAEAAAEFGIEEAIEKIAASSKGGMSRKRDPMDTPQVGDAADWATRTNLTSVTGGSNSGRVLDTTSQMKTAGAKDLANKAYGALKSKAQSAMKYAKDNPGKTAIGVGLTAAKVGAGAHLAHQNGKLKKRVAELEGKQEINLDSFHKLNPEAKPKTAQVVDISGHIPVVKFEKKAHQRLALGGKFPLDSFTDVQTAVNYFEENWRELDAQDRSTFAKNASARASELGIEMSETLKHYGSTEYSPDLEAHIANRAANAPEHAKEYRELFSKQASLDPSVFVEKLSEIDQKSGLNWEYDGAVCDPFFATYGGNSEAEKLASWSWERDGVSVDAAALQNLAESNALKAHFDDGLVSSFNKDPVQIFESLPDTHKSLIAQLAGE